MMAFVSARSGRAVFQGRQFDWILGVLHKVTH
jgi:hypothetical protein